MRASEIKLDHVYYSTRMKMQVKVIKLYAKEGYATVEDEQGNQYVVSISSLQPMDWDDADQILEREG